MRQLIGPGFFGGRNENVLTMIVVIVVPPRVNKKPLNCTLQMSEFYGMLILSQ